MAELTARHIGLCATCRHAETVVSSRATTFYLCRLSATDPHFPKYPALPVLACPGYVMKPAVNARTNADS